tara:strand:- start:152 stop:331 length:180 start_codon:yes stop_codon:yes gene_type:complete
MIITSDPGTKNSLRCEDLAFEKRVDLFQYLSDTGKIWSMENSYIIQLHRLVDSGYVITK